MSRERDQVRVRAACADLASATELRVRGPDVATRQALEGVGKEQVTVLCALGDAVEDLPASFDPGAPPHALAVVEEAERQPERTTCGPRGLSPPQEVVVRARP